MLRGQDRLTGLGVSLREALPAQELAALGRALDEVGASCLWLPEFAVREAFGQLGYLAGTTEHLRLATGVAPMAARTPALSAMAAATLDDLSDGRAVLGLGVSHPSMTEDWHDAHPRSLLAWCEEYVTLVRQLLDGGESSFAGSEVRSEGFRLLEGGRPHIPIVLAALGPRMLRLGGQLADGILLNWTTPEYVETAVSSVRAGAEAAGRPTPAVGAYVRLAVGPDANGEALRHAEFYTSLGAYARSLHRMGIEDGPELARRAADALVLRGSADDIATRLVEWQEAGVDPIALYPVGDAAHVRAGLEAAREVITSLDNSRAEHSDEPLRR